MDERKLNMVSIEAVTSNLWSGGIDVGFHLYKDGDGPVVKIEIRWRDDTKARETSGYVAAEAFVAFARMVEGFIR